MVQFVSSVCVLSLCPQSVSSLMYRIHFFLVFWSWAHLYYMYNFIRLASSESHTYLCIMLSTTQFRLNPKSVIILLKNVKLSIYVVCFSRPTSKFNNYDPSRWAHRIKLLYICSVQHNLYSAIIVTLHVSVVRPSSHKNFSFALYWVFLYYTPDDGRKTETCSVRIIGEYRVFWTEHT